MRLDQVFGFLLIVLAIYLGVNASSSQTVDGGLLPPGGTGSSDGGTTTDGGTTSEGGADGASGADSSRVPGSPDEQPAERSPQASAQNEAAITSSDFCAAAPRRSAYSDLGRANDAAIRCMDAAAVMTGRSATQFDPRDAVTRGQAAAAVAAMIDKANELEAEGANLRPLPPPEDSRFEDITADTPHRLAIARLNETPILQGYVDARYEPNGRVTRAQMASLLDRSYQYMNRAALPIGPNQFRDDERSVHQESINAVAAADIMTGVGDRRFAPRRSVRRGQLASYLALTMVRMEDKNRIEPLSDTPTR